jgi:Toprim domain
VRLSQGLARRLKVLREVRGYRGLLPATLGYLAPSTGFPPAMIAAFGMATETLPGEMVIDDAAVRGVHLTRLKPDGSGKAGTDRDKIMIGKSLGAPIVLAPVNDGLGLVIAEGIEDALSIHDATGLGAWAAGAASRMPALADRIPTYVECVTVFADADATGRTNAQKLAAAIPLPTRDVRLIIPPQSQRAAA